MRIFFKQIARPILTLILIGSLACCGGDNQANKTAAHEYLVQAKALHKVLHFTGTVQPIHEYSVVSQMDAVVDKMNAHYGQMVKKGEVLFTLTSNELQKQYNDTLTDYLKAKDNYSIVKAKFTGTNDLWKAGLLAKNNYLSEKSGLDTARVTLMQASHKLTELLEKMDEHNESINLPHLSLADFAQIKEILMANHNVIHLKATGDGMMLYPPKSGDDKTARISVGSTVKAGQVIALIGDLKGISVEIDVPEVDIDKIRPGMQARVSGVAFGAQQLRGTLVVVNPQASSNSAQGLPSFSALVQVTPLTAEQQRWIKVGMSAAIEVDVDSERQLLIPISAVQRVSGTNIVRVLTAQGKVEQRKVTTGAVQDDTVVIESGLRAGEKILYD